MKLHREGKRTVAQFLNALAVALVATMILAPLSAGTFRITSAAIVARCAAMLHAAAVALGRRP
jgi:hypothetical protein